MITADKKAEERPIPWNMKEKNIKDKILDNLIIVVAGVLIALYLITWFLMFV